MMCARPHDKMLIFDINKTHCALYNGLFAEHLIGYEVIFALNIHEECGNSNINTLHEQYDPFFTYTPLATPQWVSLTYAEFIRRETSELDLLRQKMKHMLAENDALKKENKALEDRNKELTLSVGLLNFMKDEDIE